ncbi:M14 family zinc carboxypeptidase [Pyrococcus kukulkanii]|uniref:M14 family zinc carboxypeptidase n=2 Tax=Pyrococcus kukulkanii TaxID=1609559 RepID=A0ABV4T3E6_9EURY|nr:M14 family zinc carboxypeptidase [Pyrococcus kukulkanii]
MVGEMANPLFHMISYEDVEKIVRASGWEYKVVGKTLLGRDIFHIKVGNGNVRILIVAGIHGTEPAPVNASLLLLKLLKEEYPMNYNFKTLENVELHIIPLANPDGFQRNYELFKAKDFTPHWSHVWEEARRNANGEDLNRDFMYLRQPETRAIHDVFNKVDPHLVLDLHEFYAKGGCPPKWADETEGFLSTITDTPYNWVNESIRIISEKIAKEIGRALPWKPKMRHFMAEAQEFPVVPNNVLGTHFPFEGAAKVLIETWGVGLANYLMTDRVSVHLHAILTAIEFAEKNPEKFIKMKEDWEKEEIKACREYQGFIIRGNKEELNKVENLLTLHGIEMTRKEKDLIFVPMPQKRGKISILLLDRYHWYNQELEKRRRGPFTIDKIFDVSIEVSKG